MMGSIASHPKLRGHLLGVLLGAVLPLSLAPWSWWPIGLIAVAGLVVLLKGLRSVDCFWRTFWFGLGMFGVGVSWVFISIHDHGNASVPLALFLTSLFVILLAVLFALPFLLYGTGLNRTAGTMVLAFPSIWVLGEWTRSWLFSGFPWMYLGYSHIDTWLAGWAPITGVLGISWICALSGTVIGIAAITRASYVLGNAALLAAVGWVSGWYLQSAEWTATAGDPLHIGIMQPALPVAAKWDSTQLAAILEQNRLMTRELLGNDLVIWPESAVPTLEERVKPFLAAMAKRALDTNTALLTGIPTRNTTTRQYHNSVMALGTASGIYHKQHLVPFGEYVPFERWLGGTMAFLNLPMSVFSPGPALQQPIRANDVRIGTAICYEIVFPDLVATTANRSNLLLTVSNDSWFGRSIGPKQHFQMARMRAAENRKPLIRATNDGITALINHHGKVVATTPPFIRSTLTGQLTPYRGQTPFGRWGSNPVLLCSLIMLLGAFWKFRAN